MIVQNDLTFFTNESGQKLEDRFKKTLKDVKYFDILVGYFRTSGFYKLYQDFEKIDKIRILVGLNADKKAIDIIEAVNQLEFDFESHTVAKEKISTAIKQELYESNDDYNVELGILKFIEYIKSGKLEIKAYPSYNIHAKVYISRFQDDDRDFGRVITGSSNFSESGLNSQYEFNVELKNTSDVTYALNKFEELWQNAVDLSSVYIDTIQKDTWLNEDITPYELFLKFLYEYFKDNLARKESLDIQLPKGFMKLDYQHEAVRTLSEIVEAYNGCFIADVVGLGKTYITAMYMQNLPGKKLIICPPPIIDSWQDAIFDFGVRGAKVVSLGKLEQIKKEGYEDFNYIFVDEAHRFRNEQTSQYQLLHEICFGKKVILITATPLNNSIYDFYPLIKLFQSPKDSDIPGMKNLEGFFANARNKLKQFDKSTPEYLDEVKKVSNAVRNKILKYIMIRRTRQDVKEYFKQDIIKQNLHFPDVENPHRIIYTYDDIANNIFNETIKRLKDFTFARYQPGNNLKDKYKLSDFAQTQERNLVGFMKTMLVKRLESSRYAFLQTIGRFIESYKQFIQMYNNGTVYISKKVNVYDYLDNDDEEALVTAFEKDSKSKIYENNQFQNDFIEKLYFDLSILEWIKESWESVSVDFKKTEFIKALHNDVTLKENKIIVFTESMETGLDLYNSLVKEFTESVAFYSSGVCRYNNVSVSGKTLKSLILENYDPKNKEHSGVVKILITTDVLAEGINLHRSNVIVNYDLPWNPTRVLQRVGRINRVGSNFDEIHIYNFFPSATADNELGLEGNIKAKLQAFHETLGEDAKYLSEEETTTNHKLFGEKLYDKVNNKDTYNESDISENLELKYITLLENLRDNNIELFNKIKYLPKKARTGRNYNISKQSLITFFKKGALNKIYITDGQRTQDLGFDEAIKYFECKSDCKKVLISREYYDLLRINKEAFFKPNEEDDIQLKKVGGTSNHKYVKSRVEFAIKEGRLTDVQEDYLKKVLVLYKAGVITNDASKKIKEEIEKEIDSLKVYQSVKINIPETYLINKKENKKENNTTGEIILSEFLVGGVNG